MPKIVFDKKFRTRWMFPRNIRKIHPWKIAEILNILSIASFKEEWDGNQCVQDVFARALSNAELKQNKTYTTNSGGARTYLSQLEMLGLVLSLIHI